MKKLKYITVMLSLIFLGACEQDLIETTQPEVVDPCEGASAGANVSFTKFVAIGNSLTAGYQAGALFTDGQNESVANIMATQFACVGMTDSFDQPTINSVNGCFNPSGGCTLGRLMLFDSDGPTGPKTAAPAPAGTPGMPAPYNSGSPVTAFGGNKAALNNFAVPGILLGQCLTPDTGNPGSPLYNGLWARFASQPGVKSIMQDAVAALADQGTFFMFWLGNNDVLGYATSGGSNEAIFTSVTNFTAQYSAAIDALLSVPNTKGVVGNIPSVTDIPFFKLVPYNPVVLTSQTQVDQLNAGFAAYNGGLDVAFANGLISANERDKRRVVFALGQNPVVIIDEYLTNLSGLGIPSYREATSADKLVLPASSFIGTLVGGNAAAINGVSVPLADQWVLSENEVALVSARITDFNNAIAAKVAASNNRIALADVNATFAAFVSAGSTVQNGIVMTPSIAPPTAAFSEDGVHPNGRGAAFVANTFIDAINAKFGSTVPKADVSKYKGTRLPLNP